MVITVLFLVMNGVASSEMTGAMLTGLSDHSV